LFTHFKEKTMFKKICSVCNKVFENNPKFNNNREARKICYACALEEITGGHAPEEGDFNSAHLISGEISDKDLGYLMEDLRNVELGRSTFEPYEEDSDEDWEDLAWCNTCNKDTAFCLCTYCPMCGEYWEDCQCEKKE
jgi:hypothetical protein